MSTPFPFWSAVPYNVPALFTAFHDKKAGKHLHTLSSLKLPSRPMQVQAIIPGTCDADAPVWKITLLFLWRVTLEPLKKHHLIKYLIALSAWFEKGSSPWRAVRASPRSCNPPPAPVSLITPAGACFFVCRSDNSDEDRSLRVRYYYLMEKYSLGEDPYENTGISGGEVEWDAEAFDLFKNASDIRKWPHWSGQIILRLPLQVIKMKAEMCGGSQFSSVSSLLWFLFLFSPCQLCPVFIIWYLLTSLLGQILVKLKVYDWEWFIMQDVLLFLHQCSVISIEELLTNGWYRR